MDTKQLGLIGEIKAQYDFLRYGFDILHPLGDYCAYDLMVSKNNQILKIQVKTAQKINNNIIDFDLKSQNYYVNKTYSKDDCDYFYLYCLENQMSFLLKNKENKTRISIRLEKPKNNQMSKINMFEDFLFDNIMKQKYSSIEEDLHQITNNITKYHCQDCGVEISRGAIRCIQCNNQQNKISLEEMSITREELKDLIRNKPFTIIGNELGYSDNAIRKWCDKFNLPRKKTDINKYSDEEWKQI